MTYAEKVKKIMTELQLTQADTARIFGVTQSCVSFWLVGQAPSGPSKVLIDMMYREPVRTLTLRMRGDHE